MVRAPCCEKMAGMKKGPWTAQEDQILISYIFKYGHGNWRALPKHAGLLRCGKSCRLRWINYLRPDIKRGNFSAEEEKIIIKLHEMLGNRWSAIAARLPGRTDNEIKNMWHTHLKKRLKQNQTTSDSNVTGKSESESKPMNPNSSKSPGNTNAPMSPQPSSSCDLSSVTTRETDINMNANENFPEIDETFWSDAPPADHDQNCSNTISDFSAFFDELELQNPFASMEFLEEGTYGYGSNIDDDGMEFWYDLFITAGDLP